MKNNCYLTKKSGKMSEKIFVISILIFSIMFSLVSAEMNYTEIIQDLNNSLKKCNSDFDFVTSRLNSTINYNNAIILRLRVLIAIILIVDAIIIYFISRKNKKRKN